MQSPNTIMTTQSLSLLLLCASTILAAGTNGLRVELKHRDAEGNFTLAVRLRLSGTCIGGIGMASGVTVPIISQNSLLYFYDYIAEFGIGSPPQAVQAIVSTSGNVIWTQCSTCAPRCFAQRLHMYNYSKSSTSQPVSCADTMCAAANFGETEPCVDDDDDGPCHIHDGGVFDGVLRADEFTFGPAKVNIAFGCSGHINDAEQDILDGASGFMGLGRGELSFISQVGSRRFSYCLTHHSDSLDTSPLFVDSSAGLSGDAEVISTPFAVNPPGELFSQFYYVSMSGMSVGEALLDIPTEAFRAGAIIDISFSFMALPDAAYMALKKEMSRQLGRSLVPSPVPDFELCVARGDVSSMIAPLVVHFGGGDLAFPADNWWAPVDLDTSCMLVISSPIVGPTWDETIIIGGYMQQNLHVLYDLDAESISFQPADCASI